MKKILSRINIVFFFICLVFLSFFITTQAEARAVDEVKFKQLPDGYQITINFFYAIQYQSHAPNNPSKELYVQLRTIDFRTLSDQDVDSLRQRLTWGPDPTTSIPLQQIIFEGGDPERPQMTFLFTEEVDCDVRSSADLRSLIVKVKTKHPPLPVSKIEVKKTHKPIEEKKAAVKEIFLPEKVIPQDQNLAKLMEEARDNLINKKYDLAVQLYTKILLTAQGPVKQQAQELLGVARERNGQLAHAKAEYEKYLVEFPNGPDADRVRQRLAGLITAATTPKEKLKAVKRPPKAGGKWSVQNYGNFSQFYFYDQTIPEGGATQVNRSDLSTDLDFNSRWRSDDYDINFRATGGYLQNFIKGGVDQGTISALSLEVRDKKDGLYGKFGRQYLSTGGVFGRFDGAHLAVNLNSKVKMNVVMGIPVDTVHQTSVKTERRFLGVNFDFAKIWKNFDFNTYVINQQNHGLTDRRAIGAEMRYMDPVKSFYTLIDYDVFFKALDMFLFNGHWTFPTKTTINLILDYRKSPLLTLNNAIIGQGVNNISDLFGSFTHKELKTLAMDRTTNSKTATLGVTQDLKQDLQLVGEISLSQLEGTISSGGVDGTGNSGTDVNYSLQVIKSNAFMKNDVMIYGINYLDSAQSNTYSLNINGSFPLTQKLRFMPKLRLDYRTAKGSSDNRFNFRPSLRVDYNITKSLQLEAEGGIAWINERTSGIKDKSTEAFIYVGYRYSF